MNTLELFCGTKSFSKVAAERGHRTFTSDVNKRFKSDYKCNVFNFDIQKVPFTPDVIWASHPCTYFSVASMWKHWDDNRQPKTAVAEQGIRMVDHMLAVIKALNPMLWYIENPVGMLRHIPAMQGIRRVTVTYCCYGDNRMKPTDIFTNDPTFTGLPACGFNKRCSVSGSTNALSTASQRSVVPPALIHEILRSAENIICPGTRPGQT